MASATPNPYAPPAGADPVAEPSGLWSVQGDYLLVRPGAWLPPVDLEGDGTGTADLTPVARTFQVVAGTNGLVGFAVALMLSLAWISISLRFFDGKYLFAGVLLGVLLMKFLGRGGFGFVRAGIRGYSSASFLRKQARRNRRLGTLVTLGALVVFTTFLAGAMGGVGSAGVLGARQFGIGVIGGTVLMVAPALVLSLGRRLRCVGIRDGWLHLKGVSAPSLSALAAHTRGATPPLKRARVCTFHLYRQPLRTLIGKKWWNPWVILVLAVLKARRSPRLDRLFFAWSETVTGPSEEAESLLRETWAKESAGTDLETWKPASCEWVDSPQGDMRIQSLIHLSPDGRHLAALILVRICTGPHFVEEFQASFRTRLEGGRCLYTSKPPLMPIHPGFIDVEACRGTLEDIFARHLRRLGSSRVVPFLSADDAEAFLREEARERSSIQEKHGFQTPDEEQEIPGESMFPPGRMGRDDYSPTAATR